MVAGRTKAFFAASSFLKSSVCATRFQTEAFAEGVGGSEPRGVGIFSPRPDCGHDGSERIPSLCVVQELLCFRAPLISQMWRGNARSRWTISQKYEWQVKRFEPNTAS